MKPSPHGTGGETEHPTIRAHTGEIKRNSISEKRRRSLPSHDFESQKVLQQIPTRNAFHSSFPYDLPMSGQGRIFLFLLFFGCYTGRQLRHTHTQSVIREPTQYHLQSLYRTLTTFVGLVRALVSPCVSEQLSIKSFVDVLLLYGVTLLRYSITICASELFFFPFFECGGHLRAA